MVAILQYFNLRSSMNNTPILTSIELSEIFLSSVKAHIVDHIGRLTFDEFGKQSFVVHLLHIANIMYM